MRTVEELSKYTREELEIQLIAAENAIDALQNVIHGATESVLFDVSGAMMIAHDKLAAYTITQHPSLFNKLVDKHERSVKEHEKTIKP